MGYTVKFLDSESFDNLPYNKVGTSVGVADRTSGVAYVRDTGNPMDIFTAYHELEHLKGDDLNEFESPGEDGIYYKDTGQWMQTAAPFANFIPGVGPGVSMAMGAGGTAMHQGTVAKQQKSAMQNQQPMQQDAMNQFNQGQPQQQSPAVSQVGGGGMGVEGSPGGNGGMIGKIQDFLRNQSGFWSGRTPQGGM